MVDTCKGQSIFDDKSKSCRNPTLEEYSKCFLQDPKPANQDSFTNQQVPSNLFADQQQASTNSLAINPQVPFNPITNQQIPTNYLSNQQVPSNSFANQQQASPNPLTTQQKPLNSLANQQVPTNFISNQQVSLAASSNQQVSSNFISGHLTNITRSSVGFKRLLQRYLTISRYQQITRDHLLPIRRYKRRIDRPAQAINKRHRTTPPNTTVRIQDIQGDSDFL